MNKGGRKSTLWEVQQMRSLFQKGLSLTEIGRRFKRNRTTIGYWCKGNRQKKLPILRIIKGKITEWDWKLCLVCGKEKQDLRWIKTQYCSRNCWDKATSKEISWSERYFPKMSGVYRLKDEQ